MVDHKKSAVKKGEVSRAKNEDYVMSKERRLIKLNLFLNKMHSRIEELEYLIFLFMLKKPYLSRESTY